MRMIERGAPLEEPSEAEKGPLLEYLATAAIVTAAAGTLPDERDVSRGSVVPIGLVTDGSLVWPMEVHYYYETYGGGIDAELLASARSNGFKVPDLAPNDVEAIRESVREHLSIEVANDHLDLRGDTADPFQ